MIERGINNAAVANRHDRLMAMALDNLFQESAYARPKVHPALARVRASDDGVERALAGPVIRVIARQLVTGIRCMVPAVVADFAQAVFVLALYVVRSANRRGGFQCAPHGATIEDVYRGQMPRQPLSQGIGLAFTQFGQAFVLVTLVPAFKVDEALPMPNHENTHLFSLSFTV